MEERRLGNSPLAESMMRIRVKLFATLAAYGPAETKQGDAFDVDLPGKSNLHDLIDLLQVPEPEAKVIFVNGRKELLSRELHDRDEVGMFPPIGGG